MNHARTQRLEEKVRQSTTRSLLVLIHIINALHDVRSSFFVKHIDEGVLVTDGLPASREKTIGSVSLSLYLSVTHTHTHIHTNTHTHTNAYASCIAALQFGFAWAAFGGLSVCMN